MMQRGGGASGRGGDATREGGMQRRGGAASCVMGGVAVLSFCRGKYRGGLGREVRGLLRGLGRSGRDTTTTRVNESGEHDNYSE